MARSTRNLYFLLVLAIFILISISLYGSLDSSSISRRTDDAVVDNQIQRLREKVAGLEQALKDNGNEMNRIRIELDESEKKRKQLIDKQIEKENEIYDEKAEAEKQMERKVKVDVAGPGDKGEGDVEGKAVAPEPAQGNKVAVVHRFLSKTTPAPSANVCSLRSNFSRIHTDVQMLDIYDLLKFDNPDGGVWKQGWEVTYDAEKAKGEPQLEVIVIPHSHCDPGWIKTFEEYFQQQTTNILTQMSLQLEKKEGMKFIYAEVSFLELWWSTVNEETRERVKKYLSTGQLEIVTGGWVMTDEANAHFHSMVVELMEGHEWIRNHLQGYRPSSHWSIDPFGLSPSVPALLTAANITRGVLQRVHYSVKKHLASQQQLEFAWRQMWGGSNPSHDMRMHLFPFYSYDVPHTCGPDPKICCQFDFRRLSGMGCPWNVPPENINSNNVANRAHMLYDQYRKKSQLYGTNALLVPLGDDFRYDTSVEWDAQYDNYKQLFEYMNGQKEWNVKARFGTVADYFAVLDEHLKSEQKTLPVLSGDFFTYADRDDHYWSGYFTSRPFYKQMDRILQHYLRSAEIAFSLSHMAGIVLPADSFHRLVEARRALSLFQHHDGVTGTAKDHVMKDYGLKMLTALQDCEEVIVQAVEKLLEKKEGGHMMLDETRPEEDRLAEKRVLQVGSSVVLFNTLSFSRREMSCVRVSSIDSRISRQGGNRPRQQIAPVLRMGADGIFSVDSTQFELCFEAEVPALSLATFKVVTEQNQAERVAIKGTKSINSDFAFIALDGSDFQLGNEQMSASFDGSTGFLKSVTPVGEKSSPVQVNFVRYGARPHKRMSSGGGDDLSGAYLFLPDGSARPVQLPFGFLAYDGPLLKRVLVGGSADVHILHTYTITDEPYVDISNEVDVRATNNYELAMRLVTDVDSGDTLYTDLNAMQMIRRRRHLDKLPLQAHFYPMSSSAFIEDPSHRITLIGAQALGVSSLESGWIEVVLDRRLMQDDGRGLFQGVTDNKVTQSRFRLLVEPLKGEKTESDTKVGYHSLAATHASLSLHYPWMQVVGQDVSLLPSYSGLSSPFPCDIHLVTLRTSAGPTDYSSPQSSSLRRVSPPLPEVALVLHRPLTDCRSTVGSSATCGPVGDSPVSSQFRVPPKKTEQVSLTLLYNSDTSVESLSVDPQEVKTYRLHI